MTSGAGIGITSLNRVDFALVSGSNRKCLCVLPRTAGKAKRQKIVVGDTEGYLRWLTVGKVGEMDSCYKVQTSGKLGFSSVNIDEREDGNKKVFAAAGDTIWGYKEPKTKDSSRIDKPFFTLETNLTTHIRNMAVKAPFIWAACEYVIAGFDNGTEIAYLGTDSVNDVVLATVTQKKTYEAVVACQDRSIRVISGKEFALNESCEGAVLSLCNVEWSHAPQQAQTLRSAKKTKKDPEQQAREATNEIVYGTSNGFLGSFKVTPSGLSKMWSAGGNAESKGGIAALLANDTLSVGMPQMVVGRDDGNVEVHGYELGAEVPKCTFKAAGSESIQSVSSGFVMQLDREDVVVATYTGKVVGYINDTTQDVPLWSNSGAAAMPEERAKTLSIQNSEKKKKLQALNEEVEKMRAKLQQKKDDYGKVSTSMVPVTASHNVKDKFVLETGAYWALGIEIDGPIDTVAIQSDVDIELIDTDANACIVSTTVPSPEDPSKLLACYRCTETTSRMQMKVRTIEGQHGLLRAFIIPFLTPKTCQKVEYDIKPLSLHQRLSESPETPPPVLVMMKMEGAFSETDMHGWVHDCLPEVPQKMQKDSAVYYFVSTLLGTQLRVQYRAGEAIFGSDNVSTLIILSEFIGKAATQSKKTLNVTTDTTHLVESCIRVLTMLSPKLEYQLSLSDKVAVMESLKEIEMQEQEVTFLSQEYQNVLQVCWFFCFL